MRLPINARIEGIRRINTHGGWCVVISVPTPSSHNGARTLVMGEEFTGVGAKAAAIKASGTNKVIEGTASSMTLLDSAETQAVSA